MMKSSKFVAVALATLVGASAFTQTVAVRGSGGWGAASPFNVLYNNNTVVQFDGKVIGIERSAPMRNMDVSVAALVKSKNGGTSTVDLGPAWYVDNLPTKIKMNDRVTVTGSKVMANGRSMILAQKVVRGASNVVYLRGEDGFPMWVAWRGHVTVAAQNNAPPVAEVAPGVNVISGYVSDFIEIPVGQAGVPSSVVVITGNNGRTWNVDLGPVWFIGRQDFILNSGDFVTIVPDPIVSNNERAQLFRASQLRSGANTLFLRTRNGQPVWMGLGGGR